MGRKKANIPATTISAQLTPEERDALSIVAKQYNFNSVAEFVRFCITNTCESELEAAVSFLLPTAERRRLIMTDVSVQS